MNGPATVFPLKDCASQGNITKDFQRLNFTCECWNLVSISPMSQSNASLDSLNSSTTLLEQNVDLIRIFISSVAFSLACILRRSSPGTTVSFLHRSFTSEVRRSFVTINQRLISARQHNTWTRAPQNDGHLPGLIWIFPVCFTDSLRMTRLIRVFDGHTGHFVGFVVLRFNYDTNSGC